jgi:uncharacterized cofD-like protein
MSNRRYKSLRAWPRLWPKKATWLMPGLYIKRWIGITVVGLLCLMTGLAMSLNLHPIYAMFSFFQQIAPYIRPPVSGFLLAITGIVLLYVGSRQTYATMSTALDPNRNEAGLLEVLYRRHKLDRGPHIVAIGGGTGLSTLLRGVKRYTNNITAIVSVGDDGGSSGRLRKEQGIIPPGDIRNCIAALADEERLITELFQFRFSKGEGLEGHSFGNLFITALCRVVGDMPTAIKEAAKVLNIRGQVLPASTDSVFLVAEMENGQIIRGESQIPEGTGRIRQLRCEPEHPRVLPEVLRAIQDADLILLGPGSLYTSVIPNLIIQPIAKALSQSKAPKVYIANIMTQPGETDGFSVGDHVQAIMDHVPYPNVVNTVIANTVLPEGLVARYGQKHYRPVEIDSERCAKLGVQVIQRQLVDDDNTETLRHSSKRLARSILHWYKRQAVKAVYRQQPKVALAAVTDQSTAVTTESKPPNVLPTSVLKTLPDNTASLDAVGDDPQ